MAPKSCSSKPAIIRLCRTFSSRDPINAIDSHRTSSLKLRQAWLHSRWITSAVKCSGSTMVRRSVATSRPTSSTASSRAPFIARYTALLNTLMKRINYMPRWLLERLRRSRRSILRVRLRTRVSMSARFTAITAVILTLMACATGTIAKSTRSGKSTHRCRRTKYFPATVSLERTCSRLRPAMLTRHK